MATNSVNLPNPNTDTTVQIFNDFYNLDTVVDAGTYDVVLSYFKTVINDLTIAENFTIGFFQVSENSGIPVTELLDEIRGQDQIQLSATFAYYLNNLRSNSTLLGIGKTVTPNLYAARNVIQ